MRATSRTDGVRAETGRHDRQHAGAQERQEPREEGIGRRTAERERDASGINI